MQDRRDALGLFAVVCDLLAHSAAVVHVFEICDTFCVAPFQMKAVKV